jgi:hypothetical protein
MSPVNTPFFSDSRIAGLIYLIVIATGIFSIAYVPSQLVDYRDGAATLATLQADTGLYRWGLAAGMACYLAYIALPLVLYRVLADTHRGLAALMVILAVCGALLSLINLGHKFDVLALISQRPGLASLTGAQIEGQVMLALIRYNQGIVLAQLFWGTWLIPLGLLALRSGLLPKALGVLLVIGGVAYVFQSFAWTAVADYAQSGLARYVTRPATLAEIGTCLWLLIAGPAVRKAAA